MDLTVLPVPEPQYPPITELNVQNAQAPPRFQVKAPTGAPNVVVIPPTTSASEMHRRSEAPSDADTGPAGRHRAALQQFQSPPVMFAQSHGTALPVATAVAQTLE